MYSYNATRGILVHSLVDFYVRAYNTTETNPYKFRTYRVQFETDTHGYVDKAVRVHVSEIEDFKTKIATLDWTIQLHEVLMA